jgi:uncharacterized protein (TIGR03118 family)
MTGWSLRRSSFKSLILASGLMAGLAVPYAATAAGPNLYLQHNLVSNTAGQADVTDPNLIDPWGESFSAAGPIWVSNHLSGTSTLYSGNGAITALVVTIPLGKASTGTIGKPTGQIQNASNGFIIQNGVKASFIFATEDGTISAWNAGTVAQVMVDNSSAGAVYKGLALNPSATAPLIYAANFNSGKIDVFNTTFAPTTVSGGFTDPNLPAGLAPFNIWNLNGKLYVAYAKQDANKFLDVAGAGNGVVDVFDFNGTLLNRLITGGALNSPWGLAIAPAGWGAFGGALLVGNFGNGQINAFDNTGKLLGTLQDANGNPITIAGLWGIMFGGNDARTDANTLYFMAGVPNGSTAKRGLVGSIAPPAAISFIYNAAGGQTTAVAPGEIVSIIGQTVGPAPLTAGTFPTTGILGTTLATTSVTFNNIPAPIFYTSGLITSVIVPYGVAGTTSASVVLKTGGQTTATFTIPVAPSMPGMFTSNDGGTGQAVALNQDATINTAANAAAKGSVVVLFATGEGQTNPGGTDGLVSTNDVFRVPALPVTLSIGGSPAQVLYAGSIPGSVSGLMEVEAIVPAGAATGADPVVLTVGTATSQTNVTLNVK